MESSLGTKVLKNKKPLMRAACLNTEMLLANLKHSISRMFHILSFAVTILD